MTFLRPEGVLSHSRPSTRRLTVSVSRGNGRLPCVPARSESFQSLIVKHDLLSPRAESPCPLPLDVNDRRFCRVSKAKPWEPRQLPLCFLECSLSAPSLHEKPLCAEGCGEAVQPLSGSQRSKSTAVPESRAEVLLHL